MDAPLHLQRLLDRLEAVTPNGDQWKARCPAHDDQNPSLSIGIGGENQILLKCFAGCAFDAIVTKLGIDPPDLFPPKSNASASTSTKRPPVVHPTFEQARDRACPKNGKFVRAFVYQDASGREVLWVCRYEPIAPPESGVKPEKTFRPIRREGVGYVIGDPVPPLPLYRLPELLASPKAVVFLSEGEKTSDALAALGLVATTTAHGANAPRKTDLSPLAGREIVLLPDNDDAGERYVLTIASLLGSLSPRPGIKILRLPDLPVKGDAVEFIFDRRAKGKSDVDIRVEVETLASKSEEVPPAPPPEAATSDQKDSPRPQTDSGNAERLADQFGNDIRYCHPWKKFLVWDGTRFRIDDLGRVMHFSKEVARSIVREAFQTKNPALRKALLRWAHTTESRARRTAMVELMPSEKAIPVLPDQLDIDPLLFNCANGTLDLRTGKLREHSRTDLLTKVAPVVFDPAAVAPRWNLFLEEVLPDEAVRGFVQRAVGWSLTGDVSAQVLLFCYGLGANGKSVFLNALRALFGRDYAIQAAAELLLAKQQRAHPTEVADLFKVRLAVCMELGAGRVLDEVLVKQLTGGDGVRARRMREDFWEFDPTHHLWIAANHKPLVRGTDLAIWRRLILIPFLVTIPEDKRDPNLTQTLISELPGILNWALDGCLLWQRDRLKPPPQVLEATRNYRDEMDVVGGFISECCVEAPTAKVHASEIYNAYRSWSVGAGEEPISQRDFGTRLTERGIDKRKTHGLFVYFGLGLKHHDSSR